MDYKIGTAKLLKDYYEGNDIDWLRKLRNSYVHLDDKGPLEELDSYYKSQKQLEKHATKAIKMIVSALFQNPGV